MYSMQRFSVTSTAGQGKAALTFPVQVGWFCPPAPTTHAPAKSSPALPCPRSSCSCPLSLALPHLTAPAGHCCRSSCAHAGATSTLGTRKRCGWSGHSRRRRSRGRGSRQGRRRRRRKMRARGWQRTLVRTAARMQLHAAAAQQPAAACMLLPNTLLRAAPVCAGFAALCCTAKTALVQLAVHCAAVVAVSSAEHSGN